MTAIEGEIRAKLARQAASMKFTPGDDAWSAITGHAITERTRDRRAGHARNWLMVAGSAAAVVVTVLAGTFASSVLGRPAHPATTPPAASGGTSGTGTKLPRGVVRIASPSGQPGIVLYAWSVTYKVDNTPSVDLSAAQVAKLPAGPPQLCVSDQPPTPLPASVPHPLFAPGSQLYDCPNAGFFTFRVGHTPRLGFPVAGGDAWVGAVTPNIAWVEARYADGRVVLGSVFTIPGTSIRLWALGLPGPERLGSPLPGVSLVVRDIHGFVVGQGTLSAGLPNPFPFEVDGTATSLIKFGVQDLGALTFQGKYAVFGYQSPTGLASQLAQGVDFYAVQQAYPLPASQPLQGQFGADPGFLHPWWFGVARGHLHRAPRRPRRRAGVRDPVAAGPVPAAGDPAGHSHRLQRRWRGPGHDLARHRLASLGA
jgi:hypothetical protein